MPRWANALQKSASEPRDIASLAVLRLLFGSLICASTVRFLANGWVDRFYGQPSFFFKYWGFEWVQPLPVPWMVAIHVTIAIAAALVAVGWWYRAATIALFVLFTYVELVDVTNYLNHYYLVSLLAFLFVFLPANGAFSLDAYFRPAARRDTVPALAIWLLRLQVAVVYFYAGLAKAEHDWLGHAQPLGIWLAARMETPILGWLFGYSEAAVVASWVGFAHDLLIVPLLLWRPTRFVAYLVALGFHLVTHLLFTIGIFPLLMPICATLFFEPDWPRRWMDRWPKRRRLAGSPRPAKSRRRNSLVPWTALAAAGLWGAIHLLVPLRTHLYGRGVLWHEQGMRYSWRVMLREKNGSVTYRVSAQGWPRERQVPPSRYLTSHQEREMSGQPDLILQLAHHIAEQFRSEGHREVRVYADALVSLNGRTAMPMVDPTVDLATVRDGLGRAAWITSPPTSPPLALPGTPSYGSRP